jgi:lysophospholipase L1-like esterase
MKLILKIVLFYCLIATANAQTPFQQEIEKFEQLDRASILRGQIVLYGSSTIRLWTTAETDMAFKNLKVINRGFGGSQAQQALFYFDRVVMPLRPSWLFFYEGDNDINAGKSVEETVQDYQILINMVKKQLPNCQLVIFSIKYSPSRIAQFDKQKAFNDQMRAYCKPLKNVYFLDTATPMLDKEGKPQAAHYIKDMLHMNTEGYAIWTDVVQNFYKRFR